jgi:hypothetical protein
MPRPLRWRKRWHLRLGGAMRRPYLKLSAVIAASGLSLVFGFPPLGSESHTLAASGVTVPFCSGSNFVGGWVSTNGAGGMSFFEVAFINEGNTTCRLTGYPTIQGYRNNREYPLTVGHMGDSLFDIVPTVVAPRMSGEMVLATSAFCDALNTGSHAAIQKTIVKNTYTVSVKFPHFNDPISIDGLRVDVACGLDITQVGWRR